MKKGDLVSFLADLDGLLIKHGITIGGCGYCGSPFLMCEDNIIARNLDFDELNMTYTVELVQRNEVTP